MFHELHLPFPPTDNNYYVKTKQGQFITIKGKKFRIDVLEAVREQSHADFPLTEKLLVEVVLHMPDKRKRDVLNYQKALMDALTLAKVWDDDVLIDQAHVYRGSYIFGGATRIYIHDAGPVLPRNILP